MKEFKVFESLPHAITVVQSDAPAFTVVAITDEFLSRTDLTRQAFLSQPFSNLFDKTRLLQQDREPILRSFGRILNGRVAEDVLSLRPSNGQTGPPAQFSYTQVSNKAVYDAAGNLSHIIQTWGSDDRIPVHDVPGMKDMNIARAADFFQQAPVAIAIVRGPDYVFELANEGMLSFLGRTTEAIGKPLQEVLTEARLQGLVGIFDYVRETGNSYNMLAYPATILINGVREDRFFDVKFQRYEQDGEDHDARIFCVAHNVTEQVQIQKRVEEVQQKLSFRNALLEAINEATPDGILIVDTANNLLLQNKRFAETWKIPVAILDSTDPNAPVEFANALLADPELKRLGITASGKQPEEQVHDVLLLTDGRVIERNGSAVVGEDAVAYGWAWYFKDVTDRVKQEQKFNNVVQQASMPIAIFKGEEMIVEVGNRALFELWQADESVLGKPFLEILPEMKEQGLLNLLLGVYRTGEPFYGSEVPIVFDRAGHQKETLYFNFSYQPYREVNGSITGVLAWGTDVTGQVMAKQRLIESERNLRNTILQAPVAMCILKGPEHLVEIANNQMLRFWEKTSGEVHHKPMLDMMPEARNQGYEASLRQVYTTGETKSGFGQPIRLFGNGKPELVYLSYVFEPFREWNGIISGIMVVMMDVTEQVMAKRQLEANESELQRRVHERTLELDKSNQALKRSNLSLEEFAYAASHDLKSPIRKINLLTQRLSQELAPSITAAQQQIFKRVDEAAQRMLTLIDDLLSFSHVSKGAGAFDKIDLSQKLQKVLDDLEMEVLEKNAQVSFGQLPVVWGNRRQLQQLFQNLLSNALKYTRPGITPMIHISSTPVIADELPPVSPMLAADMAYYLIEVKDNGIGFDQVDAEQIFNVFTRLHTQNEYSGTGVGLSIVKRVVENHKGHVWAESRAGEGASFKILLPQHNHLTA